MKYHEKSNWLAAVEDTKTDLSTAVCTAKRERSLFQKRLALAKQAYERWARKRKQ